MSTSKASLASKVAGHKKGPRVAPTRCKTACLCKECVKPFSEGPVKFVFTDKIRHDYKGTRKQTAVYAMANIIVGCIVFFFYFMYLYFTLGQGLLHTDHAKYISYRHICICSVSVALGFGVGIMVMSSNFAILGWVGRRVVHSVMTVAGTALYFYGASCVVIFNKNIDYTNWEVVLKTMREEMGLHEFLGVTSCLLLVLSLATSPLALLPLNISKFVHSLVGCIAFLVGMGAIFSALIKKEVFEMVDKWEMFYLYWDTLIILAMLIVFVLIKPLSRCYMADFRD